VILVEETLKKFEESIVTIADLKKGITWIENNNSKIKKLIERGLEL
jgi:hypothetical protein